MDFWADTYWADTYWTDTFWSAYYLTVTPDCRMLLIKAENRIMDIAKEDRFIEIPKCHDGGGV